MLGSFREKIQNVQQDITTGFRHLLVIDEISSIIPPLLTGQQNSSTNLSSPTTLATGNLSRSSSSSFDVVGIESGPINVNAGVPVLRHYQQKWSQMHNSNQQNVQRLSEATRLMNDIDRYVKRRSRILDSYLHVAQNVAGLHSAVDELQRDLDRLFEHVRQTETLVLKLQSKKQERLLMEIEDDHQLLYGQSTERLQADFEQFKARMEEEHKEKAREHERRLLARTVQQRQEFQAAFEADLAEYKRTGRLRKRSSFKETTEEELIGVDGQFVRQPEPSIGMKYTLSNKSTSSALNTSSSFTTTTTTTSPSSSSSSSRLEHVEMEPDDKDQKALLAFLD